MRGSSSARVKHLILPATAVTVICVLAFTSDPRPTPKATAPAIQPAAPVSSPQRTAAPTSQPVQPAAPSPKPPPPIDQAALSDQATFDAWLAEFRIRAIAAGIRPETLDRELADLTFDPRVVALDGAQPDRSAVSTVTFAGYRAKQISDYRIARGRRLSAAHSATLAGLEDRYGVPRAILLSIWGIETSYGAAAGDFDLVRSLASLAFEGRRQELFTTELIAALRMLDAGTIARDDLIGSWAGATGQTQFMPSSYLAHAADGDGDGRRDIWTSEADALASIAAYFAAKGWRPGEPWATPVFVPPTLDRERIRNLTPTAECPGLNWRHSRWLGVDDWRALGLIPLGAGLPAGTTLATLIEPDGPDGAAFLTYANYRAIMRYNCSNFYALTVGQLAQSIGERPAAAALAE
jgi:lytic murein transglycosylase